MNYHESVNTTQLVDSSANSNQAINVGFSLLTRITSMPGSPTFTFAQPLISSRLFLASWVLIGSQIILLLLKHIFHLEKLPVLDICKGQVLQIPIGELQNLLQYLGSRQPGPGTNQGASVPSSQNINSPITFPTELPPDSPLYIAIYVTIDYSNELYTPSFLVYVPILSFPGLRGAIPFIILSLLAVIFVRCVVPPETTGAKPLPKQNTRQNQSLNLTSEDVVAILRRFGRYFSAP